MGEANASAIVSATRNATVAHARSTNAGRIGVAHYFLILGQLALFMLLLRQYQIDSSAFIRLALLAFAGFAVHALLPLRYRIRIGISTPSSAGGSG